MRTLRLSLAGALLVGLLGVSGVSAAEPSQTELAWAAIRDGVFADQAGWEARFEKLDASDEQEVRELRRLVRDQVRLLASLDLGDPWHSRFACLAEARSAVAWASEDLDEGLTSLVRGRPNAERVLRDGRERLRVYWEVRDEVDCSTAGEVAAFLASGWKDIGLPFRPITGRRVEYDYVASGEEPRFERNALRVDGDTTYETWEWNDPLLPTDLTNRMNMATFSGDWDGMVIVASLLFEGPEGYWTGTGQGRTWVLAGHGVYEGLSAILTTTADIEADTLTVEGAIYAGPLPPVPEPPRTTDDETLDADEPTPGPTADAAAGMDEPTATSDRGIELVIEPDQAVGDIMESLVDAGLLLDSEAFQNSVMRDLVRRLIEPGTYDVSRPMSLHDVIELLAGDRFDTPAGSDDTEVEFVIEPGQTVDEIEGGLVAAGLLSDTVAFRYLVIGGRVDELIAPGAYTMRTTMTPRQIVQRLTGAPDPPTPVVTLDMRPGRRIEQTVAYLQQEVEATDLELDPEEFLELARNPSNKLRNQYPFLKQAPDGSSLEGFLYPGTYEVPIDITAEELARQMLGKWDDEAGKYVTQARKKGLDAYEVLIIASLVERVARAEDDRAKIANVYWTRLDPEFEAETAGLMQVDPTVVYATDTMALADLPLEAWPDFRFWHDPDDVDLATVAVPDDLASFQTYQHVGLPGSPIATPTRRSIKAALNPDTSKRHLYLHHCPDADRARFAKTLSQHERNIVRCGQG